MRAEPVDVALVADPRFSRDRGVATPVEMMMVLIVCLVAVMFVSFLGRLHAAGVEVTTVAQSAARAASLATGPTAARPAAAAVVAGSSLASRCTSSPTSVLTWERSDLGTWRGGSVTVRVTCVMDNAQLATVWAPGRRTVRVSDTQRIDVYRP
ncbi:MAG: hypothetical protein ACO3AV_05810 [Ilumatobacteraceae bacterium]